MSLYTYNSSVPESMGHGQSFVPGKDQPAQRPAPGGFYDYQQTVYNQQADDADDPFKSIGGGKKLANGSWVPKDHPLAQQESAQPQAPQAPQAPGPQAQTPFMPNGMPMAQPAPTAVPVQTQQPTADPFAATGGGVQVNGGWVPKNHPLAAQAQSQQQMQPSVVPMPQTQATPQQPWYAAPGQNGQGEYPTTITNPPANENVAADLSNVYKAGQVPTGTAYTPQQISQFVAPDMGAINTQQQALIQQLLLNPGSMNDATISKLKGRERDTALAMQKQLLGQAGDNLAARGIDPSSEGYAAAVQRGIMENTTRGLLGAYRDIDINAIATNRQDMLNALGVADTAQNSALSRAISGYNATLAGQESNRAEQLAAGDTRMREFTTGEQLKQAEAAAVRQAIDAAQNQSNINRQFNQQNNQFDMTFRADQRNSDLARMMTQQQNDRSWDLSNRQLAEQVRQAIAGESLQGQQVRNQQSQFEQSLGFDREKFNYGKEQDQLAAERSAAAAADAQARWEEQQLMDLYNSQFGNEDQLWQWLMGGGQ